MLMVDIFNLQFTGFCGEVGVAEIRRFGCVTNTHKRCGVRLFSQSYRAIRVAVEQQAKPRPRLQGLKFVLKPFLGFEPP